MSDTEGTKWIANQGAGFGASQPGDDLLHRENIPAGASVTETYYFGFDVTDAAIQGIIYIWFHPNLGVVTAGTMISRGFRSCSLAADYFSMRAYLAIEEHTDPVSGVLSFPGGLRLMPIKPMTEWRVELDDPAADTSFDLLFTAAMPAAVRADQKHFDQNMHVQGPLCLRGRRYLVDCYRVRDRSWHNARSEDPMPLPPYDWITLSTGPAFAMNLSLFDDLRELGDAGGALHRPPQLLQDGWVYVDGGLRRIVDVDKRTFRTSDILRPLRHEIRAVDDLGNVYEITGESIGGCNWNGWPNMLWHQCLTRWTCNGQTAWGEVQEVQWHEAVRLLRSA